eukprot:scaffold6067_cov112-Isochrysis_galbana.AAC.23
MHATPAPAHTYATRPAYASGPIAHVVRRVCANPSIPTARTPRRRPPTLALLGRSCIIGVAHELPELTLNLLLPLLPWHLALRIPAVGLAGLLGRTLLLDP